MQQLSDRRMRKTLFGLWCLAWLIIAVLMLAPVSSPVRVSHGDLIAHFLAFAGLAFGTVGFSRRGTELTLLAAATIAGGVALEVGQGLVPHRTSTSWTSPPTRWAPWWAMPARSRCFSW